jgi:hypothetical protein
LGQPQGTGQARFRGSHSLRARRFLRFVEPRYSLRRVAAVAMLPCALSRSDFLRSVHVGRSRYSWCCHLIVALWLVLAPVVRCQHQNNREHVTGDHNSDGLEHLPDLLDQSQKFRPQPSRPSDLSAPGSRRSSTTFAPVIRDRIYSSLPLSLRLKVQRADQTEQMVGMHSEDFRSVCVIPVCLFYGPFN